MYSDSVIVKSRCFSCIELPQVVYQKFLNPTGPRKLCLCQHRKKRNWLQSTTWVWTWRAERGFWGCNRLLVGCRDKGEYGGAGRWVPATSGLSELHPQCTGQHFFTCFTQISGMTTATNYFKYFWLVHSLYTDLRDDNCNKLLKIFLTGPQLPLVQDGP